MKASIANGMVDVFMAKLVLGRPRFWAVANRFISPHVIYNMRMRREAKLRCFLTRATIFPNLAGKRSTRPPRQKQATPSDIREPLLP